MCFLFYDFSLAVVLVWFEEVVSSWWLSFVNVDVLNPSWTLFALKAHRWEAAASDRLGSPAVPGVWRRSASMAAWAVWRSRMSASPGRSRCPAGVCRKRWSGRWDRRRGNCSLTERPSLGPPWSRPSWARPPSSPCSSTSVSCSRGCPLGEVRAGIVL